MYFYAIYYYRKAATLRCVRRLVLYAYGGTTHMSNTLSFICTCNVASTKNP